MDYLGKFNDTFKEFGNDIMNVFPDDDEFRMYNVAIQASVMIHGDAIIDVFYPMVVVPFGDKIIAKDESFFINHDYDDIQQAHEDAGSIIQKIKNYWSVMSDSDRETVWKYFKVLVLLARKIRT